MSNPLGFIVIIITTHKHTHIHTQTHTLSCFKGDPGFVRRLGLLPNFTPIELIIEFCPRRGRGLDGRGESAKFTGAERRRNYN